MKRFIAVFDFHYGWEVDAGKRIALHDQHAMDAVLAFASDFKPDLFYFGGDILDCGPISHHHDGFPGRTENLRLGRDMEELRTRVLLPAESTAKELVYQIGNHEVWLQRLFDRIPGISDTFSLVQGLGINRAPWTVKPQGAVTAIGKLYFIHGDQIRSSLYPARWAVEAYGRSIRFGHFHRAQLHTKISALDVADVHTGMAVPGMCRRDPTYGHRSPNQWMLGFLWGYVFPDGSFCDTLTCIVKHRFVAEGRVYRG